eukprot:TRINITY_DN19676_c0_g1_i1.p1 TRINITY_DN19676_c0_g1~~TRINITY_DN19676_c0_g1_i1.p1  ORF type:complete len:204 (+),score=35.96 TRINITY_DN19676_c0_g1_i1:127-738(+)
MMPNPYETGVSPPLVQQAVPAQPQAARVFASTVQMPSTTSPEKEIVDTAAERFMRSKTEIVRPSQQAKTNARMHNRMGEQEREAFNKERDAMLLQEAQRLADMFRPRVETLLEDSFDEYKVVEFEGDLTRKMLAKIFIGEEDDGERYIHLRAARKGSKQQWECYFASYKTKHDPLWDLGEDPEMEFLPSRNAICDTDAPCVIA